MSEIRVARKQFDLKSIQVIRQIKKCYKDYDMMDLFEDVIAERIMKDKLKILKREVSKFKSEKKLEGRYKHPLQISKFLLNFCDKLLTPSKSYLKRFAKNLILQDEDPFTLKKQEKISEEDDLIRPTSETSLENSGSAAGWGMNESNKISSGGSISHCMSGQPGEIDLDRLDGLVKQDLSGEVQEDQQTPESATIANANKNIGKLPLLLDVRDVVQKLQVEEVEEPVHYRNSPYILEKIILTLLRFNVDENSDLHLHLMNDLKEVMQSIQNSLTIFNQLELTYGSIDITKLDTNRTQTENFKQQEKIKTSLSETFKLLFEIFKITGGFKSKEYYFTRSNHCMCLCIFDFLVDLMSNTCTQNGITCNLTTKLLIGRFLLSFRVHPKTYLLGIRSYHKPANDISKDRERTNLGLSGHHYVNLPSSNPKIEKTDYSCNLLVKMDFGPVITNKTEILMNNYCKLDFSKILDIVWEVNSGKNQHEIDVGQGMARQENAQPVYEVQVPDIVQDGNVNEIDNNDPGNSIDVNSILNNKNLAPQSFESNTNKSSGTVSNHGLPLIQPGNMGIIHDMHFVSDLSTTILTKNDMGSLGYLYGNFEEFSSGKEQSSYDTQNTNMNYPQGHSYNSSNTVLHGHGHQIFSGSLGSHHRPQSHGPNSFGQSIGHSHHQISHPGQINLNQKYLASSSETHHETGTMDIRHVEGKRPGKATEIDGQVVDVGHTGMMGPSLANNYDKGLDKDFKIHHDQSHSHSKRYNGPCWVLTIEALNMVNSLLNENCLSYLISKDKIVSLIDYMLTYTCTKKLSKIREDSPVNESGFYSFREGVNSTRHLAFQILQQLVSVCDFKDDKRQSPLLDTDDNGRISSKLLLKVITACTKIFPTKSKKGKLKQNYVNPGRRPEAHITSNQTAQAGHSFNDSEYSHQNQFPGQNIGFDEQYKSPQEDSYRDYNHQLNSGGQTSLSNDFRSDNRDLNSHNHNNRQSRGPDPRKYTTRGNNKKRPDDLKISNSSCLWLEILENLVTRHINFFLGPLSSTLTAPPIDENQTILDHTIKLILEKIRADTLITEKLKDKFKHDNKLSISVISFFLAIVRLDHPSGETVNYLTESTITAIFRDLTEWFLSPYKVIDNSNNKSGHQKLNQMHQHQHSGNQNEIKEGLPFVSAMTYYTLSKWFLACNDVDLRLDLLKMTKNLLTNIIKEAKTFAQKCASSIITSNKSTNGPNSGGMPNQSSNYQNTAQENAFYKMHKYQSETFIQFMESVCYHSNLNYVPDRALQPILYNGELGVFDMARMKNERSKISNAQYSASAMTDDDDSQHHQTGQKKEKLRSKSSDVIKSSTLICKNWRTDNHEFVDVFHSSEKLTTITTNLTVEQLTSDNKKKNLTNSRMSNIASSFISSTESTTNPILGRDSKFSASNGGVNKYANHPGQHDHDLFRQDFENDKNFAIFSEIFVRTPIHNKSYIICPTDNFKKYVNVNNQAFRDLKERCMKSENLENSGLRNASKGSRQITREGGVEPTEQNLTIEQQLSLAKTKLSEQQRIIEELENQIKIKGNNTRNELDTPSFIKDDTDNKLRLRDQSTPKNNSDIKHEQDTDPAGSDLEVSQLTASRNLDHKLNKAREVSPRERSRTAPDMVKKSIRNEIEKFDLEMRQENDLTCSGESHDVIVGSGKGLTKSLDSLDNMIADNRDSSRDHEISFQSSVFSNDPQRVSMTNTKDNHSLRRERNTNATESIQSNTTEYTGTATSNRTINVLNLDSRIKKKRKQRRSSSFTNNSGFNLTGTKRHSSSSSKNSTRSSGRLRSYSDSDDSLKEMIYTQKKELTNFKITPLEIYKDIFEVNDNDSGNLNHGNRENNWSNQHHMPYGNSSNFSGHHQNIGNAYMAGSPGSINSGYAGSPSNNRVNFGPQKWKMPGHQHGHGFVHGHYNQHNLSSQHQHGIHVLKPGQTHDVARNLPLKKLFQEKAKIDLENLSNNNKQATTSSQQNQQNLSVHERKENHDKGNRESNLGKINTKLKIFNSRAYHPIWNSWRASVLFVPKSYKAAPNQWNDILSECQNRLKDNKQIQDEDKGVDAKTLAKKIIHEQNKYSCLDQVLRNHKTSERFQNFYEELGKMEHFRKGEYKGGLMDRDVNKIPIYNDNLTRILFHVNVLIDPKASNAYGRTIGNDYIKIIYDESGDYEPNKFSWEGMQQNFKEFIRYAQIIIKPIHGTKTSKLKVHVFKNEIADILCQNDGRYRIYDDDILHSVTRHLCLNICMANHSLVRYNDDWKSCMISTAINKLTLFEEWNEQIGNLRKPENLDKISNAASESGSIYGGSTRSYNQHQHHYSHQNHHPESHAHRVDPLQSSTSTIHTNSSMMSSQTLSSVLHSGTNFQGQDSTSASMGLPISSNKRHPSMSSNHSSMMTNSYNFGQTQNLSINPQPSPLHGPYTLGPNMGYQNHKPEGPTFMPIMPEGPLQVNQVQTKPFVKSQMSAFQNVSHRREVARRQLSGDSTNTANSETVGDREREREPVVRNQRGKAGRDRIQMGAHLGY